MLDRRRGIVLPFGGDVFRGKRLFFDGLEAQTDIAGERGGWSLQKHDHVSRFVLLDGRQWDYTMTSGRYTVSGGIISAAVSSSAAEDFLADIDPGIDGTVKLFEGTAPVTTGFAATGMTVSLYNRGGQKLSEYTVAVKGDLNADGVVNAADVTEMQAHIAGTKSFTGVFLQAGDLNGDGSITAADIPLLQQLAAAYIGLHTGDQAFRRGGAAGEPELDQSR